MKKSDFKARETKYEHYLIYGYGKKDVICHYQYGSQEELAKAVAFACLQSQGDEYNDLLARNQHSLDVHNVLDLVQRYVDSDQLNEDAATALEDNNSTWPGIKKDLKKIFNKAGIVIEEGLQEALDETDRSYQLTQTGKGRYQVILNSTGRATPTVTYFDDQITAINHILKSRYEHSGVVVGDAEIAQFLQGRKFSELNQKKNSGDYVYSVIAKVLENKWELTKSYEAFCNIGRTPEKER